MTAARFGDFPEEFTRFENASTVLLPVPFDGTCSWRRGAAKGPDAILRASPYLEVYDMDTGTEVYREGISVTAPVTGSSPEEVVTAVEARTAELLAAGKCPVVLGGEHTVALGAIRAVAAAEPSVSLLHLDAHSDRRDAYEGSSYSHACIIARAQDCIDRIVSVGVRSMDACERDRAARDTVITAADVREGNWAGRALDALGDPVYVTIDLDVFDPACMPSTGTPEPGGLDWYDVTGLLARVAANRRVIGFDVVELAPSEQHAPDFLAAKLVYTFLSRIFASRRALPPRV